MMRLMMLMLVALVANALQLQAMRAPSAAARGSVSMGVINENIDKENPKVVNTLKASEIEGSKGVFCRCWKSGTFPLCNGAHVAHNKETGDNVGPLIISKD
uniref:Iron-binding zinc finger CDGSH type domain-containing protein n=1 Tax=Chrysotila carterae TaxID=13221 RepID=A0A7S4C3I3_CHRCT|mmetsp:Transcript_35755/g.78559  ORF Transcript_35755/g.78559 Transcript_35755/m.78559 type:complete len:101 (+) Transcript_35755:61-363(+)